MFERPGWMRLVASGVAVSLVAACGGGGGGGGGNESASESGGQQAQQAFPVDQASAGNIGGSVSFEGTPPEAEAIDMSSASECQPEGQPMTQHVLVNDNGTLRNVFVHVVSGPIDDLSFPTPADSVEIDQQGCRYHPHVMGIQTGQTLAIKNADGFLHNINAKPQKNRGFNISQPVSMTSARTFSVPEVMIPVNCDVHSWMNAYIGVQSNPYFDVTGNDGSFELDRLPPGQYVVEAWHEKYGTLQDTVTVATGQTAQADFTFNASMAENARVPLGEPLIVHHGGRAELAAAE